MDDVVAQFRFLAVGADGDRAHVVLMIERPYRDLEVKVEEWVCPMSMHPLLGRRLVRGICSVQALGLALNAAQFELTHFVEDGGTLFFDDGSPWEDGSLSMGS